MSCASSKMLLVSLLGLFAAIPAFSQLDTATVSGRITDSTGAVIAAAQITVVDIETNFESQSVANAEGIFRVPSLRPGPYRLQIKAAGFKTYNRSGLD